jgi:hypothetical protein
MSLRLGEGRYRKGSPTSCWRIGKKYGGDWAGWCRRGATRWFFSDAKHAVEDKEYSLWRRWLTTTAVSVGLRKKVRGIKDGNV